MKLFMKTTTDKYELPLAVADSTKELASMLHLTNGSVASAMSRGVSGYHKVIVDDWFPDNDGGEWKYGDKGEVLYRD